MHRVPVLGVGIHPVTTSLLEDSLLHSVRAGVQRVFAYVNVHAINLAQSDTAFCDFLNTADVTYCDGEGVRFGARILGYALPPRIVLTYYVWDLLALCERENVSVFLLGARAEVLASAVTRVRERFPHLRVAGTHDGYFPKDDAGSTPVLEALRSAQPDLLFVGFGMPAQEAWISRYRSVLSVKAILPCGSMIDYVAGARTVAPVWMAQHGFEWLYRLAQEPRRLWKRYLLGNPMFVLRVLWSRFFKEKGE